MDTADVLDGVSPLHNYLIFNLTQKHLQGVKVYVKEQQVLLDIQDMFMKLFGCTAKQSNDRIDYLGKDRNYPNFPVLSKHRPPGVRGSGRVVATFQVALKLILEQKCAISDLLRGEILEIATRAAAGDLDLEEQIRAQRNTVAPEIKAIFMSGISRSKRAREDDPVPNAIDVLPDAIPLEHEPKKPRGTMVSFDHASNQSLGEWFGRKFCLS